MYLRNKSWCQLQFASGHWEFDSGWDIAASYGYSLKPLKILENVAFGAPLETAPLHAHGTLGSFKAGIL